MMKAKATARANIALAKYWGKSDERLNLPAVPSISLTLDPLLTETEVDFAPQSGDGGDGGREWNGADDEFILNGQKVTGRPLERVRCVLDEVRGDAGISQRARVQSVNHFPTASGLASSASGFAALAAAAYAAAGLQKDGGFLSQVARRQSASAARSIFGGLVYLPAGIPGKEIVAQQLYPADYWDLRIVVAVIREGEKSVSSTSGMLQTQRTSPYFAAWVQSAHELCSEIAEALKQKDFERLGQATERSAFAMHASAMAANPSVLYWLPGSLHALQTVTELRQRGVAAFATMDAGPHVKVLCLSSDVDVVQERLGQTPGVLRTLRATPGPGVQVVAG